MTLSPIKHATFTIERTYDAAPARVFRAFADKPSKMRWFVEDDGWTTESYELDFRTGGYERAKGGGPNGMRYTNDTLYHDIVPNERLVFAYAMDVDGRRISASLTTITLTPEGAGTRLSYTEQGAFYDDDGASSREEGCRWLFEKLAKELARAA
jgi:uncharacterized protein YndB with AHSA1/START domain